MARLPIHLLGELTRLHQIFHHCSLTKHVAYQWPLFQILSLASGLRTCNIRCRYTHLYLFSHGRSQVGSIAPASPSGHLQVQHVCRLFWAGFTLFWLYHFFFDYLIWFGIVYDLLDEDLHISDGAWRRELEGKGRGERCLIFLRKIILGPLRDLVDFWLCVETPGLVADGGITVAQKKPFWGELCCFCCVCSNLEASDKPCCGNLSLCRQHFSKGGNGNPGEFFWDKVAPTSNARLDYGHDYFRNRAADTFTNVPHTSCLGGTSFDFPADNIRAVLLVGPKLIGKRTILRFAAARGFETLDLGAEDAPTPEARWENALAKFKALRDDPNRENAAPVIFGAGGTVWEEYAMPSHEVVRMAKEEGVEVVSMLWEADSGDDITYREKWVSETTLTKGLGEGGGAALCGAQDLSRMRGKCRAPAALTMHRWAQRVDSDVQRSDLESSTSHYAEHSPDNPWNHIFGRRLKVDMDPEEALVRILMPYRGRGKGPNILWGGCTKGAPSLDPVDVRTFPKVQQEPYEHREAAPQSGPSLRSQLELIKLMVGKETGKARLKGSGRGKK